MAEPQATPTNVVRSRPDGLLRYLLEGTSSKVGREFLQALVRSAAQAMEVSGVWVTQYIPERNVLRTLAFWLNGAFVEDYEYSLKGTPCELVIEKGHLVHFPDGVIELFPDDADLPRLNAVSYAGIGLDRSVGLALDCSNRAVVHREVIQPVD